MSERATDLSSKHPTTPNMSHLLHSDSTYFPRHSTHNIYFTTTTIIRRPLGLEPVSRSRVATHQLRHAYVTTMHRNVHQ